MDNNLPPCGTYLFDAKEPENKKETEQKPRVLTKEEAFKSCVVEYRSGKTKCVGKDLMREGNDEYYGSIWRLWTSEPTDEQRKEIPWRQIPKNWRK